MPTEESIVAKNETERFFGHLAANAAYEKVIGGTPEQFLEEMIPRMSVEALADRRAQEAREDAILRIRTNAQENATKAVTVALELATMKGGSLFDMFEFDAD